MSARSPGWTRGAGWIPESVESARLASTEAEAKALLARRLRHARLHNIVDQTSGPTGDVAIYALADPRDVQTPRYVGQTRNPAARFVQHVNAARLWLPDELPWWIKRPELLPLYTWIRELHADGGRLPVMFVVGWTSSLLARSDERRFIAAYLRDGLSLLNFEAGARSRLFRNLRR
jgi:hypothetical protein